MDQINKILSGLKKRRASSPPGEPSVGKQIPKNRIKEALIGAAVLGVVCAAGWLWWGARHKAVAPVVVQAPAKPISAPQEIAPPTVAQAETSAGEVSQPIAASQPIAEVTQQDSSGATETVPNREAVPAETPQELPKEIGQEKKDMAVAPERLRAAPSPEPVATSAKPHATAGRKKHEQAASAPAPDAENVASEDASIAASAVGGGVDKQIRPLSAQQRANNEFVRANGLVQQGDIKGALAGYEAALQLDPGHEAARQTMVVLLLQSKRNADAERVLQDGLALNVKNSGFAMLLARIQLERDASWSALLTLQKTLPYAEQKADYQAFVAALLQRLNHHKEAVAHYQAAVALAPGAGVWWMGLGISLQALQRTEDSRVAFRRALESHSLNADLQSFVNKQLKEL